MKKNYAQRAKVRELIEHLSPAEIGKRLGISRQRVYQLLADEAITLNRRPPRQKTSHADHLDRHTRGAVSELAVAVNLLELGWDPYVPLIKGYDIIAVKNSKILTIEVRRTRRRRDGAIITSKYEASQPADHVAFVIIGEPIIYEPALPSQT